MPPPRLTLFCLGLCLLQVIQAAVYFTTNPNLHLVPSSMLHPLEKMTLQCNVPHRGEHFQSQNFQLMKDGEVWDSVHLEAPCFQASFPLGTVSANHSGSYRCRYWKQNRWSSPSDPLELTGSDSLPKPLLLARPFPLLLPQEKVTLQCQGWMNGMSFTLYKDGESELVKQADPHGLNAEFSISSPGRYSCRYHTASTPDTWSDPSEPVEIVIPDRLPKPFFRASRSSPISLGETVDLECDGKLQGLLFELFKEGQPVRVRSRSSTNPDRENFHLVNLSVGAGGSYSCRTHSRFKPFIWSEPSNPVELVMSGELPKPTLLAHGGSVFNAGVNVTLSCQASRQGVKFALLKEDSPEATKLQSPEDNQADFLLEDVTAYDSGKYRCVYFEEKAPYGASQLSEPLEIQVNGLMTKPSLSVPSGSALTPGRDVTLRCSGRYPFMIFELKRDGIRVPLAHEKSRTDYSIDYIIPNVGYQDIGNYSCHYSKWTGASGASTVSYPSDPLELKLPALGKLPQPTFRVWPHAEVTLGANLKLRCSGQLQGMYFELYKDGEEVKPTTVSSSDVRRIDFHLNNFGVEDQGTYTCRYYNGKAPYVWSYPSEPLKLILPSEKKESL
ncbi:immunoglobulin superfamily member 1-like [Ornithorhynchus anatinus]|uniref:immunoglobulin superfamily member 1-like n=1 Tax=Ornithorhynchus anatinus TaxID=9258 RepID=UPI0010A84104|nr:immunoglobulin superfamily member 1-like [Ornithorhynchus anatinus]